MTPLEMKRLSHIDEQECLCCQMSVLLFYPAGNDTRKVIKESLGKALVFYNPWAGRMREAYGPDGQKKLMMDCTSERVLFVVAEANVTLAELGGEKGFFGPPFYPAGNDTRKVIKEALGKALVFYNPWAGRMREAYGPDGQKKLMVDCTSERVLFVVAEANVTLAELGGEKGFFGPPFPCLDELLCDLLGSSIILDSPLLLFQVSLMIVVNVRSMLNLHPGYYGNAIVLPTTVSQARKIIASLEHTVELVKRAKEDVTPKFVRSVLVRLGPVPTHF